MAEPRVTKNIGFPAELAAWLEAYSDETGISQTQLVIWAVAAYRKRIEGADNQAPPSNGRGLSLKATPTLRWG